MVALLEAERLPTVELADHLANVVVAVRDGRVAGCGGLETYKGCDAGLVRSMVVEEALRGTGVGARILAWVEERARSVGLRRVFLFTVNARDFYARHGYRAVTLDDFPTCARGSAQYRAVRRFGREWGVAAMAKEL